MVERGFESLIVGDDVAAQLAGDYLKLKARRAELAWLVDAQGAATVADLDHGAVAALAGQALGRPAVREPAVEAVRAARAA